MAGLAAPVFLSCLRKKRCYFFAIAISANFCRYNREKFPSAYKHIGPERLREIPRGGEVSFGWSRHTYMNYTLVTFVVLYLLGTLALGAWAGTRIKSTSDFAVAGRSLPLIMVVTTTFATWFGAETVMGIPAKFVQGGLHDIIEDPFGAGTCLILVGMFFATKLYKQNLLTIGDFYRNRYGKGIEVFCSVAIIMSYLGWVAAQITALGLVFSVLTNGAMSETTGMIVGTLAVLIYVVIGGFLAVREKDKGPKFVKREPTMGLRGMPEGEDGLIARAVDALFDDKRLSPALEAELAAALGREAVFDLIATVGFYSVLGYILMTYDTPIDAAVAKEMAERPLDGSPR